MMHIHLFTNPWNRTAQLANFISQTVMLKTEIRDIRSLLAGNNGSPRPALGVFTADQSNLEKQLGELNHLLTLNRDAANSAASIAFPVVQVLPFAILIA